MAAYQSEQVDQLFGDALVIPLEQRTAFLVQNCPDACVRALEFGHFLRAVNRDTA